eukprot:2155525-Pleurochrysis_carterae.AAC.2
MTSPGLSVTLSSTGAQTSPLRQRPTPSSSAVQLHCIVTLSYCVRAYACALSRPHVRKRVSASACASSKRPAHSCRCAWVWARVGA